MQYIYLTNCHTHQISLEKVTLSLSLQHSVALFFLRSGVHTFCSCWQFFLHSPTILTHRLLVGHPRPRDMWRRYHTVGIQTRKFKLCGIAFIGIVVIIARARRSTEETAIARPPRANATQSWTRLEAVLWHTPINQGRNITRRVSSGKPTHGFASLLQVLHERMSFSVICKVGLMPYPYSDAIFNLNSADVSGS